MRSMVIVDQEWLALNMLGLDCLPDLLEEISIFLFVCALACREHRPTSQTMPYCPKQSHTTESFVVDFSVNRCLWVLPSTLYAKG